MADATAAPPAPPFDGLYAFVRTHLLVVNNVIAASCFAVGALDFLAPKLWLLPRIIYSATATLALAMLIAALMPGLASRIQARFFGPAPSHVPLWRRGVWQFGFALLCVVSIVGFASVAKASAGGLAASQFPAVRDLQAELLSIRSGIADVSSGVGQANAKLDVLVGAESDPRRALASRGYSISHNGLKEALGQGDEQAVAWFAQIKVPIRDEGVMGHLVGDQPWNPRIAALLDPAMFSDPAACVPQWIYYVSEPVDERLRAYARLCGKDKLSGLRAELNYYIPRSQPDKREKLQRMLAVLASMR
ncbi:hypothetical protein SNE35_25745 [Paucibacter sp. R3-3]|uniref:Uncharacterized protein n=1 Tax=Roseateles agri TaxID=3098619 RepID=A0ABU5DQF8_9BURK|nr:hypothetical protein [Paucibacter sp. R3-3]MDY0747931.1 hypothetical protein [Paucibacter sp. R3-3]